MESVENLTGTCSADVLNVNYSYRKDDGIIIIVL